MSSSVWVAQAVLLLVSLGLITSSFYRSRRTVPWSHWVAVASLVVAMFLPWLFGR